MSFLHKNAVNLYTSYELDTLSRDSNTMNAGLEKYRYNGCGIGFDSRSHLSWSDGNWGKNVIIFGVDMSSSVHTYTKKKKISVLGEGPSHDLDNTSVTAEAKYPVNFTESGQRFVLSLHYNGRNSFLFVKIVKMY